jgi:endonuclease/exonuclease/phosphatase family metal-dependent hydrolase
LVSVASVEVTFPGTHPTPTGEAVSFATDYSFRIGTFNTQLDSWIFDLKRLFPKNFDLGGVPEALVKLANLPATVTERRKTQAEAIADRIRKGGFYYDVLALNEVFHEDARAILSAELATIFPYQVTKAPTVASPLPSVVFDFLPQAARDLIETFTPGAGFDAEDSGLMLLSRFPIVEQDFALFDAGYLDGAGADAFASKGALYVKLHNPRTGGSMHVVSTHLQENSENTADIRQSQLATINALLSAHLSPGSWKRDDVFLLGDLNIAGNLVPYATPTGLAGEKDPEPTGDPPKGSLDEYEGRFGHTAPPNLFSVALRDTWLWHTSVKDLGGTTTEVNGSRLDLLLYNDIRDSYQPNRLVPQHVSLAYNLCLEAGVSLSDHHGLNAEFNHYATHATPRTAIVPTETPGAGGHIEFPGVREWYRIDKAGTFCVAAFPLDKEAPPLAAEVYAATDLSRPIAGYRDLTREIDDGQEGTVAAHLYALAEPPYYVSVSSTDGQWTGDYSIRMIRNQGQSPDDAVIVDAFGGVGVVTMPDQLPKNADDVAWFRFDLEVADSGEPQHLQLTAGGDGNRPWAVRVLGEDHLSDSITDGSPGEPGMTHFDWFEEGPGPRYVQVARTDSLAGGDAMMLWGTNLTILHPQVDLTGPVPRPVSGAAELNVVCDDETDPETGGSDTILMTISSDGLGIVDHAYVHEFDDDDRYTYAQFINPAGVRYLHGVDFQLIEDDSGPSDYSPVLTLPPLTGLRDVTNVGPFQWEDGTYEIVTNRSHRFPPP